MNQVKPKLSIVIPWSARPELETALAMNREILLAPDIETVIVSCHGDFAWLQTTVRQLLLPRIQLVDLPYHTFNKSLALNLGVAVARADRLFFLDADIVLDDGFLPAALALVDRSCVVTAARAVEMNPQRPPVTGSLSELAYSIRLATHDQRQVQIETNCIRFADGSRSAPGLILFARMQFEAVDGMNSELEGWGWEDLDYLLRLQLVIGVEHKCAGAVKHLTHAGAGGVEGNMGRSASQSGNFALCLANYHLGHFLGTFQEDVATWRPRIEVLSSG